MLTKTWQKISGALTIREAGAQVTIQFGSHHIPDGGGCFLIDNARLTRE